MGDFGDDDGRLGYAVELAHFDHSQLFFNEQSSAFGVLNAKRSNTNTEDEDVGQQLEAPEVCHGSPIVGEGHLAKLSTTLIRALGFTQCAQSPLLTVSIGRCNDQSDQVATVPED